MPQWISFQPVSEPATTHSSADGAPQDQVLVRAASGGDSAALDTLVDRLRCVPRILCHLNRQRNGILRPSDVEDLAQDTLLRVWQKLPDFPSYSSIEMWAYRFCQYEFLNRIRKLERQSRTVVSASEPPEPTTHDPEPDPVDWGARLDAALDELSHQEQDVVRMKHFEQLTFDDIGRDLGLSPNTAKARYYRGLVKLRDKLGRSAEPEDLP